MLKVYGIGSVVVIFNVKVLVGIDDDVIYLVGLFGKVGFFDWNLGDKDGVIEFVKI